MSAHLHIPLRDVADNSPSIPASEVFVLSLLLGLVLIAVGVEILRLVGGQFPLPRSQFWLRMLGGAVMLLVVLLMTAGALFLHPEDGRIFGEYYAFCSLVLLGVLMIVREDVARTRRVIRDDCARLREDRLKDLESFIEECRQNRNSASHPTSLNEE